MSATKRSRFWRKARIYFRRFRITALLCLLALVIAGLYITKVGLPDFVKRPLLDNLHARGIDLDFKRLRWGWMRGFVAQNVSFTQTELPDGPRFMARELELRLSKSALLRGKFQISSIALRHGTLTLPVVQSGRPPRDLVVTNIQSELRFTADDGWELDNFQATLANASIHLSASIAHASAFQQWSFFRAQGQTPSPDVFQKRVAQFADALERTRFAETPELRLTISGDARDPQSFTGFLTAHSTGAETPWGTLTNAVLTARLELQTSGAFSGSLNMESATTAWAQGQDVKLDFKAMPGASRDAFDATLDFSAVAITTRWGESRNAEFKSSWTQSITNAKPLSGAMDLTLLEVKTAQGLSQRVHLTGTVTRRETAPVFPADTGWWTNISEVDFNAHATLAGLETPQLQAEEIDAAVQWNFPTLTVTNLSARLYGGTLTATADLDINTRELRLNGVSDVDAQKFRPLLTPGAREWISQFSWKSPPHVEAFLSVTLPAWTNREPDWRAEVQPTLMLDGEVHASECAFRGLPLSSARSQFSYSNMTWRLPDLVVTRPEGVARAEYWGDDRTKDYRWTIHSELDWRDLNSLLEPEQQRVLDALELSVPPIVDAEVSGRWHHRELTAAKARIAATNFSFRGQAANALTAELDYTNKVLRVFRPQILRGTERVAADYVEANFNSHKVYLTNGFSDTDPMAIVRAIGSNLATHFEPFQFQKPPVVFGSGMIAMREHESADALFHVSGGPFHWWKFKVPQIAGDLHWKDETIELRNVRADCYGGHAAGRAAFDWSVPTGTDFSFDVTFRDIALRLLMRDLGEKANQLEGEMKGFLTVSTANTKEPRGWQGNGRVQLRDGLLWELPVFGIFSPALDGIWPGLGSSRFSEGNAKFKIVNSIISSDDLEIRSPSVRMQYHGSVDFAGTIDARVQAELLRDVWVVGPFVSAALTPLTKLFEYSVSGTLRHPVSEPLYVPKILLMPLHPLRTLRELFPQESSQTASPQSDP